MDFTMMQPSQDIDYDNPARIPLDIVGGNGFGRYQKISSEQTFNMIVSDGGLVNFAGYTQVASIAPNGVSRGIYNVILLNKIAVVIDDGFYLIDTNNNFTRAGTLLTQAGDVYMSDNLASQIVIMDKTYNAYVYEYSSTPATFSIVPLPFLGIYVTYQDTYFIAPDGNSNQWFLSAPSNGKSWPALAQNVGELQSKPCKMMATVALARELLVFGQTCMEPWYDAGLQLFPYQRDNYNLIDYGVLNQSTIGTLDNRAAWVGVNEKSNIAIFAMYLDNQPQRISNDGLDFILAQLKNPKDSYGFMFKMEGHSFYMITFVTDNLTYLFDFNTNMFFTLTDQNLNHHIARRVVYFNGTNYFISLIDGNVYQMDSSITTYNGYEIPRIRIIKNLRLPSGDRFIMQKLNISMEQGVNQSYDNSVYNPNNLNPNPTPSVIDISLSEDGGYQYGHIARKTLLTQAQRRNAVNFYNLGGVGNDNVLKFRFGGFGRFVVAQAELRIYQ